MQKLTGTIKNIEYRAYGKYDECHAILLVPVPLLDHPHDFVAIPHRIIARSKGAPDLASFNDGDEIEVVGEPRIVSNVAQENSKNHGVFLVTSARLVKAAPMTPPTPVAKTKLNRNLKQLLDF